MSNGAAILRETTGAFTFDSFVMEKVDAMQACANFSHRKLRAILQHYLRSGCTLATARNDSRGRSGR